MRWWPWSRRETRADSSYTDTLVAYLVNQASGGTLAQPAATAALECASGVVSRAFASAEVTGDDAIVEALTPDCLAMVGRALIRHGEVVFRISVEGGGLVLLPCHDHDVNGGPDPEGWEYTCHLSGPSRHYTTRYVPAQGVCHFTYSRDPARPWCGVGPLQSAALAGKLSAETTAALADESSGPRGSYMPVPKVDGDDPALADIRAKTRTAAGRMLFVESMADSLGTGGGSSSPGWMQSRFGPSPTDPLVQLHATATREVLSAVGISPALFDATAAAAAREAWRQALHGVIQPIAELVVVELRRKLDPSVNLSFDRLMASDLQGRARSFQSMVGAGMDIAKAAALSGLMVDADG